MKIYLVIFYSNQCDTANQLKDALTKLNEGEIP
jgi:hypothetical protein